MPRPWAFVNLIASASCPGWVPEAGNVATVSTSWPANPAGDQCSPASVVRKRPRSVARKASRPAAGASGNISREGRPGLAASRVQLAPASWLR